ncbi:peptidoglycan DD-metalloendopeptidase family protein [Streptomyces sp. NBC_00096]|uniref:peptidoglycan DD-metalloendopeptidase family protein n=1 Tax=Streptomyces sp. NBC_00096 TaxID=2975650 RepID=UPI0032535C99
MTGAGIALPLLLGGTAEAASAEAWKNLAQCESGGRFDIVDASNKYFGGLQISEPTWLAYGGDKYAPLAHQATEAEQIAVAEKVLAGQGAGAWGACQEHISGEPAEPDKQPPADSDQSGQSGAKEKAPGENSDGGKDRADGTYIVKPGDSLSAIALAHAMDRWEPLYEANSAQIEDPNEIRPGQKFVMPKGAESKPAKSKPAETKPAETKPAESKPGKHRKPVALVDGPDVSMTNGYKQAGNYALGFHTGIDYAAPAGRGVNVPVDGKVHSVGWEGAFGKTVVIQHGPQEFTRYAHLSEFKTKVGKPVKAGTRIGLVGSTGNSTGAHLHFEVGSRADTHSSSMDPEAFLASHGVASANR